MTTTQQSHPWRAAARTAAQALVAVPAVLTTLALVADMVAGDDLAAWLPAGWAAWLAAAAVTCSALAGLLARVMAVPAVDAWLARLRLSSAPDGIGPDSAALSDAYTRGWLARDEQDLSR